MRAAIYDQFRAPLSLAEVRDPAPARDGAVIEVKATGVCRSDWHGWMGHDRDIRLPHVPGHEISGVVAALGADVRRFAVGDPVTLPFVCGCGNCAQCLSGNQQVCDHQSQPGFTHWGSYAEFVAIDYADENLVRLPESVGHVTAASLGCRFATAFRAIVSQGQVGAGQCVAVHGCGGVGLSAIMIACALGATTVAIDVQEDALALAADIGADVCILANDDADVPGQIRDATGGGVHVSLDAFGGAASCLNSIACLRKRGKHIQVGLMAGGEANTPLPMDAVIANELEIIGSHGLQAHCYDEMLDMIGAGRLAPDQLVRRTITLDEAATELADENLVASPGVTVIDRFSAT